MSRGSRFGLSWAKVFEPADPSEWGMHILVDKEAHDTEAIDIIAIHGLNGHWKTTWTDEATGTNWLRDYIPKHLKTARVMSFSYNSSVQFSKSVSSVADFAGQLLESLAAKRISEVEQDRPMLFVCHSLGGIVFKQACNRAYQKDCYNRLLVAVAGVAFFGTPHRGSSIASLGTVLSRVLKAASFGTNTNTQLLKELERGSPVLDDITTTYANRKYDFKICSFYETDKMDFMSSVVVDRHSAVLGIEGETVVPINGNHRSICRFTSSDSRMPVVLENLRRMLKHWKGLNQEFGERELLEGLGAPDYLLHKDRNPSPTQGTCSWALSHPEFLRWHESKGPALLWLSANPGCGKSVMMSFLIDHFQSTVVSKHVHLCYWFFKSDNQRQRGAIFALRGILRQLLVTRRSIIPTVQAAAKDKSMDTLQDVWELLIHAVQAPSAEDDDDRSYTPPVRHTTICLIDGLDECEADAKEELLLLFRSYFRELERLDRESKPITLKRGFMKILIASRPENWIKVVFDRLNPSVHNTGRQQLNQDEPATQYCAIRLKGEDESDLISADISLVVRAAIADLVDQGFPELLLYDIQKQLIARADRTFIWITLIIDLLKEKVESGASKSELDRILQSRTVDQIFAEILRKRPDYPKTRKMFSILLAAARPLTVGELSVALALTAEHSALSKPTKPFRPGLQSIKKLANDIVYPFENNIRSLGGHFVRIICNEVYFVHETAREFLLEEEVKGLHSEEIAPADNDWNVIQGPTSCDWQYTFSHQSCHALLLDLCVTYLYLMGQVASQNHVLSNDEGVLIEYVSTAWFVHFVVVADHIDPHNIPYYHNLCHPKFPGFSVWTRLGWHDKNNPFPTVGMNDDEIQDFFIKMYHLEPRRFTLESDEEYDHDFDEIQDLDDDEGHNAIGRAINMPRQKLIDLNSQDDRNTRYVSGANPTARPNHHFPLSVDKSGFVSIDYNVFSDHLHTPRR
ncbi:hypothetical protein F5B22DRAFT_496094 [Xylaria bambusicola]|uniref:uncharacterized protein n=1 Tax=Xylaria bambusicola TaxID=326684 RepID=UPI002007D898|nr:uncharacterized protein F5B22DRAFT_496094 [Xylaria bambusicola]KAI0505753.1 hypothetical protein F5B22DRAFT_496094 [Xylaria bambusicola]